VVAHCQFPDLVAPLAEYRVVPHVGEERIESGAGDAEATCGSSRNKASFVPAPAVVSISGLAG
jgi:hypothetical protein